MVDDDKYNLNDAVRDIMNGNVAGVAGGVLGGQHKEKLSEKEKQQRLKQIKKRVVNEERKDPYIKNKIIQNSATDKAGTNPNVKEDLKNFRNITRQKTQLGRKMQTAKSYEDAQKIEKQYNEEDKKQTKQAFVLKTSMLQEDLKRALEGPAGWIKNAKGCFGTAMVCVSVIGGGVLALILSIL